MQPEALRWLEDGANLGLQGAQFPGIDIDVTDGELAALLVTEVRRILGPAPCRIGSPPKTLLMYRLANGEEPFGKKFIQIRRGKDAHRIEVLADGQQYLIHGVHPTGRSYEWDRALDSITPDSLTPIRLADIHHLLSHLEALIREQGFEVEQSSSGGALRTCPPQEILKAPGIDALQKAVGLIPNDEQFADRTAYIRMCYAIKAASQDFQMEGQELFTEWAARWEDGSNDPEEVRTTWDGMRGPFAIGWSWIAERAQRFGFNYAAYEFTAEPGAPSADMTLRAAQPWSDRDMADEVTAENQDHLRYVSARKQWLVYDGSRWAEDQTGAATQRIGQTLVGCAARRGRQGATPKQRSQALAEAKRLCSRSTRDNVANVASTDPRFAIAPDQLDANDWILNTPGGVVDLRIGELRPHSAGELLAKRTEVAPTFASGCPLWMAFLLEASGGDASLVGYLQRLGDIASPEPLPSM